MKHRVLFPLAISLLCATSLANAQDDLTESDDAGTLNPQELSLKGALDRLRRGESHPMEYALGYGAAKAGMHKEAKEIFEGAVKKFNSPQAMTWLAWLADNGLAGPEDPVAAAAWDRRAAEAGSEVGMFNYGLDLLRGRGVAQNEALGRKMVENAARRGDKSAIHLIDNNWDLESVTPDADSHKYKQYLY